MLIYGKQANNLTKEAKICTNFTLSSYINQYIAQQGGYCVFAPTLN
jgi:hypothetical protein